jgi:exoribonuclease II
VLGSFGAVQLRKKVETKFPAYLEDMANALTAQKKTAHANDVARSIFKGLAVAIDDVTTSEVDDAIAIDRQPSGGWRVTVHVADPSALINVGDPLDLEAAER